MHSEHRVQTVTAVGHCKTKTTLQRLISLINALTFSKIEKYKLVHIWTQHMYQYTKYWYTPNIVQCSFKNAAVILGSQVYINIYTL